MEKTTVFSPLAPHKISVDNPRHLSLHNDGRVHILTQELRCGSSVLCTVCTVRICLCGITGRSNTLSMN